jgi:hypothetical protein
MAAIGKAILNSTLLSPTNTRRWLKPRTFTGDTRMLAVGAPWEIYRVQINGRLYEVYTKSGDWGAYSSVFAAIPDYNFGFSVLTAGLDGEATVVRSLIGDIIGDTILPTVELAAKEEAEARFVGTFSAPQGSGLNTTITLVTDDYPALRVSKFVSNGTDLLALAASQASPPATYTDLRLYPNELYHDSSHVGFTSYFDFLPKIIDTNVFSTSCISWIEVGVPTWGTVGLADMVFEVDPNTGKAIMVELKALRITLETT